VAISSDSNGAAGTWWNGSSFTANLGAGGTYNLATGTTSWTWNRPALTPAITYLIVLRITDNVGNVRIQTLAEGNTFYFDQGNPTVTILDPNATFKRSLPTISGTASDATSNIAQVQVWISTGGPLNENFYWNGTAWQGSVFPLSATAALSQSLTWTLTGASLPTWATGVLYKVKAQSTDEAANQSSVASSTFTFDGQGPSVAITDPYDPDPATVTNPRISTTSAYNGIPAIFGTSSDTGPSGVTNVRFRVMSLDSGSNWFNQGNGLYDISDGNLAWYNAVTSNSWANWYSTFTFQTGTRFRI